jgi:hypothetical protein
MGYADFYFFLLTFYLKQRLHPIPKLPLMGEQPFFTPEVAAITYQFSAAANNAVAGNDDRNIITAVGCAYRSYGFGIADSFTEFQVTDRFPVRDVQQFFPDDLPEIRSFLLKRQIEYPAGTGEILTQLNNGLLQHFGYRFYRLLRLIRLYIPVPARFTEIEGMHMLPVAF